MKKFANVKSVAATWLLPNIDTDVITPMKRILYNMEEMGKYSFAPYRFTDGDGDNDQLNPDFPLNQPQFRNSNKLNLSDSNNFMKLLIKNIKGEIFNVEAEPTEKVQNFYKFSKHISDY